MLVGYLGTMGWYVTCVPWFGTLSAYHGLVCDICTIGRWPMYHGSVCDVCIIGTSAISWCVMYVLWVGLCFLYHGLVCDLCTMCWSVIALPLVGL